MNGEKSEVEFKAYFQGNWDDLEGSGNICQIPLGYLDIDYDLQLEESRVLNSVSSDRVPVTHREPQAQLRLGYTGIRSSPEDVTPR